MPSYVLVEAAVDLARPVGLVEQEGMALAALIRLAMALVVAAGQVPRPQRPAGMEVDPMVGMAATLRTVPQVVLVLVPQARQGVMARTDLAVVEGGMMEMSLSVMAATEVTESSGRLRLEVL